jgi:hypothetical protein
MKTKGFFLRRGCLVFLLMVLLVCASTLSAQAGGVETWYYGVGSTEFINITDYNITPVKTIGDTGNLTLVFGFSSKRNGIDEPTWYPPVKITAQIRSASSGAVLAQTIFEEGTGTTFTLSKYLTAGTQIQIFIDVSSLYNPPGPYRKAGISYYYMLGN